LNSVATIAGTIGDRVVKGLIMLGPHICDGSGT
jgi:hypothetical protein